MGEILCLFLKIREPPISTRTYPHFPYTTLGRSLARASSLAGDIDTARAEFATVVDDPSLPDQVRQRVTGCVRQFDKQISGGGSDVSGFFDVRAGYDDNINAATDLNSIVIPLFSFLGPGTLGAGAVAQADEFYEVQGGVSAVTAIGRQDRQIGRAHVCTQVTNAHLVCRL